MEYYINIARFIEYEVLNMESKILNPHEVGKRFFNYTCGKYYVYDSVFKADEIKIAEVVIVKDYTRNNKNSLSRMSKGIIGAILAGVVGVLVAAGTSQPKWDVDLDVYTTDGRVIELRIQSESLIRRLYGFVKHPDPRAKFRKERGIL